MELLNSLFQNVILEPLYENSFFIYGLLSGTGYLLTLVLFIIMRKSIAREKGCTLNILKLLSTSQQEWFCFYPISNRGISSEGLSHYLDSDQPLIHLKDFCHALSRKFSFDVQPLIEEIFSDDMPNPRVHKINIKCPHTQQSCDLFVTSQTNISLASSSIPRQNDIIFWLRDISEVSQKEDLYQKHHLELEQKNNLFSKILNMMPQPLWVRTQAGQLIYCNQFYAEALDSTATEVMQDNKLLWQESNQQRGSFSPPENFSLYEPLKRSIVLKEERRLYQFKEEKIPQLDLVFGQAMDLTDLEEAMLTLKQHTMAYQEVMDNLSAGVTIYGADKKLKFFNHAYALLFETDENWLNTHPSLGEILDDVRDRRFLSEQADYLSFKKQQLQMVSSLLSPYQQLEHLPDGRTIRRIAAPHPLGGVFFIFENVTNSLIIERQYNTQLAVHRASLDHLYEGVAVFGSDNRLKLYNPAFSEIWGMPEGQFKIDQHMSDSIDLIQDIVHYEGDWTTYRSYLISNVTDRISKKTRMMCKEDKIINISYVPLPDGSHLLSCMDVSDTHRIERMLRERNEALENADRLKSDFIAHVSYKLRVPLNTITGFSEMLVNAYFGKLNSQQSLYCQTILESGHRLLNMVNNILDLAVIEGNYLILNPSNVDLFKFLKNMKDLFAKSAFDKDIDFKLECDQTIGLFWADEYCLQQILKNLLKNSFLFTPPKGKIVIKAERSNSDVILQISDTGIGIPTDDLTRVFNKFERGSNNNLNHESSGLGLTLVKALIDLQKGDINIQSNLNEGTIVTCYFKMKNIAILEQAA